MAEKISGFVILLAFSLGVAVIEGQSTAAPSCPAQTPCSCDTSAKVIHCEEPSLTIDHISFDEVPPLSKSDIEWKLLNLSFNFIHALHDNPFLNVSKIESIDLSHNQIEDVARDAFNGVAAGIKTLDLSYNKITTFPAVSLMAMNQISKLDLGDNGIETIDKKSVEFIEAAIGYDPKMKINLKGNPFYCDCNLKIFVNFMKTNFKNIENPHDLKCASPPNLAGRVLGALVDEELLCYTTSAPTTQNPDSIFPPACPAKAPCWCDYIGNIFCSKGDMLGNKTTFTEIPHIIDLSGYVWSFLHLSGHQITHVKTLAFFPLQMKRLSLTNNRISTISEGAFFGTELELETVLLEGNNLVTIPDPVLELPNLSVLDLSLNDIFVVTQEKVDALHSLIYADVHGGQVVKHDFEAKFGRNAFNCTCEMWYFAEFVKFNKENFQDRNLMFCMHSILNTTVLKRIDQVTDADFPGCPTPTPAPEPTVLPHPDNPCPAVFPCWCTYSGDVICSRNLLLPEDCPTGRCPDPPALTAVPTWRPVSNPIIHSGVYLDLNEISTIESNAFKGVRTTKLDLSHNRIQYIYADAFTGLEDCLKEMILTGNGLVEVPEALFPMHLMETLDLSFNEIQTYHDENVKSMQAWRTKWIHNGTHLSPTDQRKGIQMRLGSNHINCNKEICALRYWVTEEPWDFIDEQEIWCTLPAKWFGKKLHNVSLYELGCDITPDIKTQLQNALNGKHTMAGLFAFAFLICLALGAYVFYLNKYEVKASPVPVQFKNPLSSSKQKNNDKGVLVEEGSSRENDYAVVDQRKTDAPANQTFDNFADSL